MVLERVGAAIAQAGFTPRGTFHPAAEDGVPELRADVPARTLDLVGNAPPSAISSAPG